MGNDEKKGKENVAEAIRKKLDAHKRQNSLDYYNDKIKPLQQSAKTAVNHYRSSENHPIFFTRNVRKKSKVLSTIILLFFLIIIFVISLILYSAFFKNTQRELDAGFGKVVIDNEEEASLIVSDELYLAELKSVSFVFGDGNSEYFYNPGYVGRTYNVYPSDLRLSNFKKINYASLFFEYNSERNGTDIPVQMTVQNLAVDSVSLSEAGPFVRFWTWVNGYF